MPEQLTCLSASKPLKRRRRTSAALQALRQPQDIAAIAQRHGVSLREVLAWRRSVCWAAVRWQQKFKRGL